MTPSKSSSGGWPRSWSSTASWFYGQLILPSDGMWKVLHLTFNLVKDRLFDMDWFCQFLVWWNNFLQVELCGIGWFWGQFLEVIIQWNMSHCWVCRKNVKCFCCQKWRWEKYPPDLILLQNMVFESLVSFGFFLCFWKIWPWLVFIVIFLVNI